MVSKFEKRSRRPALDHFNSALNYLYGMTYGVVEGGIFAKGLDPFIGLLHTDQYNEPTLAFDLIETHPTAHGPHTGKAGFRGKTVARAFCKKRPGLLDGQGRQTGHHHFLQ